MAKIQYLLMLDGLVDSFPVGIYDTDGEAKEAAAGFGLTEHSCLDALAGDLADRVHRTCYQLEDYGVPSNYKIRGWTIVRLVNGAPAGAAGPGRYDGDSSVAFPLPVAEEAEPDIGFLVDDVDEELEYDY